MKNKLVLYFSLALLTGLWSCKSEDSVFEQTADERLNESLANYQKQLSGAQFGWKGIIYPGAGGGYSFYFKFNDQNRVVMYSDFDKESAVRAKESSYRLKALQTPSLIFDTYSYLHVLADPDGNVNGGNDGEGLKSDFEFSFVPDTTNSGTMTLIGTKNQSRLILTKATQEEEIAYGNGGLAKSLLFSNIAQYITYFKRITIGGVTYEISADLALRTITFTWLEGTTKKSFTTDYYYSSTGVSFINPFVNGSQTITGFTNITWDADKLLLGLTAGGAAVTLAGAAKPISADVGASKRWYNEALAAGSYWVSVDGFHVNGVDDAFKVNSLKSGAATYYFYLYWPKYGTDYDAFAPVFLENNSLSLFYGDAPNASFAADGRVVFSSGGVLGTFPTGGPALDSRNYLYDKSGFYLIQVSETVYDMVSAKDGKGWIRWER